MRELFDGKTTHHYFRPADEPWRGDKIKFWGQDEKILKAGVKLGYVTEENDSTERTNLLNRIFSKYIGQAKNENNIYMSRWFHDTYNTHQTTGFAVVNYFHKKYPKGHIKLIGFTKTKPGWHKALKEEKELMRNMKNVEFMKF